MGAAESKTNKGIKTETEPTTEKDNTSERGAARHGLDKDLGTNKGYSDHEEGKTSMGPKRDRSSRKQRKAKEADSDKEPKRRTPMLNASIDFNSVCWLGSTIELIVFVIVIVNGLVISNYGLTSLADPTRVIGTLMLSTIFVIKIKNLYLHLRYMHNGMANKLGGLGPPMPKYCLFTVRRLMRFILENVETSGTAKDKPLDETNFRLTYGRYLDVLRAVYVSYGERQARKRRAKHESTSKDEADAS
jgi:hypothetical protein